LMKKAGSPLFLALAAAPIMAAATATIIGWFCVRLIGLYFAILTLAFGQLLKPGLLAVPRHCCMNVHASLLPKYRGAAPINWALINGETQTGVTTMKMDAGLDTGDMLLKRTLEIDPRHSAIEVHDLLSEMGGDLTLETLDRLETGDLVPEPQNDSEATHAPKLKKEDGLLHWDHAAEALHNRVRGLEPWPGAYTFWRGQRLRLAWTEVGPGDPQDAPGVLVRVSDYGLEVGTRHGRLIVREVQPEGKKRMSVKSFLAGHPVQPGEAFDTAPAVRPEER